MAIHVTIPLLLLLILTLLTAQGTFKDYYTFPIFNELPEAAQYNVGLGVVQPIDICPDGTEPVAGLARAACCYATPAASTSFMHYVSEALASAANTGTSFSPQITSSAVQVLNQWISQPAVVDYVSSSASLSSGVTSQTLSMTSNRQALPTSSSGAGDDSNNSDGGDGGGLTGGKIAGITIGLAAVGVILTAITVWQNRKRKARRNESNGWYGNKARNLTQVGTQYNLYRR